MDRLVYHIEAFYSSYPHLFTNEVGLYKMVKFAAFELLRGFLVINVSKILMIASRKVSTKFSVNPHLIFSKN